MCQLGNSQQSLYQKKRLDGVDVASVGDDDPGVEEVDLRLALQRDGHRKDRFVAVQSLQQQ